MMRNNEVEINELKLIENLGILFDNKIVLYGAGVQGTKTYIKLKAMGIQTAYFCDGNKKKWGKYIDGTEIISLKIFPPIKRLNYFYLTKALPVKYTFAKKYMTRTSLKKKLTRY